MSDLRALVPPHALRVNKSDACIYLLNFGSALLNANPAILLGHNHWPRQRPTGFCHAEKYERCPHSDTP
jgi:hypothetical protein